MLGVGNPRCVAPSKAPGGNRTCDRDVRTSLFSFVRRHLPCRDRRPRRSASKDKIRYNRTPVTGRRPRRPLQRFYHGDIVSGNHNPVGANCVRPQQSEINLWSPHPSLPSANPQEKAGRWRRRENNSVFLLVKIELREAFIIFSKNDRVFCTILTMFLPFVMADHQKIVLDIQYLVLSFVQSAKKLCKMQKTPAFLL